MGFFTGQTVWITGASSGIGRGLAVAMAAEGGTLILSGRNETALHEVAALCPGSHVLTFDAAALDGLPAIVARAETLTGRIDILVNNAGIGFHGLARDTGLAVYRTLMEVDFFAPVNLTQLVLPAMRARGSGHVAIVSSLSGKFGNPGASAYCAAKFALIGYFDSLRSEVAHEGVHVSVITPGFVRTSISAHGLGPDGKPHNRSNPNVERGIDTAEAAEQIIAGFKAGLREIPVGRGPEMALLDMLKANPDSVFDLMAGMGKSLATA